MNVSCCLSRLGVEALVGFDTKGACLTVSIAHDFTKLEMKMGFCFLLQAARFLEESNHQRKVQLFFTITLTLLEHQLLVVKQKCAPAALAADRKIDVEAMFRRITNAIKVQTAGH